MNILSAILLAAGAAAGPTVGGTAKITSSSVYYDQSAGFAYFSGKVHVNDQKYQIHADRAYAFMSGTNELKRIVALGHVAMTNETKRAYGAKASYYREHGMVVLSSGDGIAAEVRDEAPDGVRVVRGRKIKFWIDSKQVEVVEAEISAPSQGGLGGMKKAVGR
ncbi:MAG: hypothetical protein J6T01_00695 [Kiritimatiellae bacterium]|nr:hypothetical protein [Kiritimatiellia bacterium]